MKSSLNRLSKESSLYLLQHAENPVHWFPWGEEAFEKAKSENKLVLISIGYSSCHWCHVMERECFEDVEVAEVMNRYFVCIKVDREERPDVDQIYMNALQLMSGQGGWPLNCFTLADGRPIYGGTYFPKERWISVLQHLNALFNDELEKVKTYAEKLTHGIQLSDQIIPDEKHEFSLGLLNETISKWRTRWDQIEGGPNHAPKFPLPNNYQFLLRYGCITNDASVLSHVKLTLDKMAKGGIYDQLGGGFMRYSTDMIWKVPHFEKMLYDNAQLISLYSEAYRYFKDEHYKEIIKETISFCKREWWRDGAFYASTDADSEGVEGKFYVWTKNEFEKLTTEKYPWAKDYYNLNSLGYWEDDFYILLRRENDEYWAKKNKCSVSEFKSQVKELKAVLLSSRQNRIFPVTDTKQITSWNAMMLSALCDAWKALSDPEYLEMAVELAHTILRKALRSDGGLNHLLSEEGTIINGFLEDYAAAIEAFISLFEISSDVTWLKRAETWMKYTLQYFYDSSSHLFYFTSSFDRQLIARKTEFTDNVTPSPNSSLAKSLYYLSVYLDIPDYLEKAQLMLKTVAGQAVSYGAGFSNWLQLYLNRVYSSYELVITGNQYKEQLTEFFTEYYPQVRVAAALDASELTLFKNRFKKNQSLLYLCQNNSCKLPVETMQEIFSQLK